MPERLSKAAAQSGLTPETYLAHRAAIVESQRAVKEAASKHQTLTKKAQNDGVNPKHIKLLMQLQKLEAPELDSLWRDLMRFSAWEGRPLGPQLGIAFSDDSPAPNPAAVEAFKEKEVLQEGYTAGCHGVPPEDCPAAYVPGSPHFVTWHEGYKLGADFMKGLGKTPGKSKVVAKGKRKSSGNPEDRPAA